MAIESLTATTGVAKDGLGASLKTGTPGDAAGFGESLGKLLGSVEQESGAANDAISRMLAGTGDVHEAMIAMQRADMMLQFTVQVRNKLVQAYQDVMRMPI
jgi:flagellar hook-basal body complex protein FliE